MKTSPIFWGIIICAVSLMGWVVSIVFNVVTLGAFRWVSNVLGIVAFVSLPVAVIVKLIRTRSIKKHHGK